MAAISFVFTLPIAATRLCLREEPLDEIASKLEPEDGVLWVYDSSENGCYDLTLIGLDSVKELLADKPTLAFIIERMERTKRDGGTS